MLITSIVGAWIVTGIDHCSLSIVTRDYPPHVFTVTVKAQIDKDGARDILRSHWLQLAPNLEAELIVHQLQERRVLSNDEVNETISKKDRAEQATTILTAMETKSLEQLRVFAEVLTSCGAPMSLVGKKMLQTIGELRMFVSS